MLDEEIRIAVDAPNSGSSQGDESQEMPLRTAIYPGRGAIEGMFQGMMNDASRGAGQCRSRSIQATVDMLRMMSCTSDEIRLKLTTDYGLSEEEADSYLV